MATEWGVYDTVDRVWIGDDGGPKIFMDPALATIAAMVVDEQLGQTPGRTRAREYVQGPLRLRDTVPTRMGTLRALQNLEGSYEPESAGAGAEREL